MGNKKFKEIYRAEKQKKKVVSGNRNEGQKEEKQIKERANKLLLDMSPQRVFQNWMASDTKNTNKGNGKPLTRMITDDEGIEEDSEQDKVMSKKLQKDNVATEEVIKIINDQRSDRKKLYMQEI
ncbi:hypothetical protein RhiirA1_478091 [Rhizophagus irregularis]|uniref:Uncharacterized protein n=1 Tax=Rhizophagus irregularis TaxID=588596 RepID=A0A2N0QSP1_9GLOM|nr:hypothetical protein RhiirA1_478091 [Rhizophagus irregularis]